jgi:hypothetical protein
VGASVLVDDRNGSDGFDRIVIVDWSANSSPKLGHDSIWIAVDDGLGVSVENVATRSEASARLDAIVTASGGRTLIGVDFSLGFPSGTASALGLRGAPWHAIWQELAGSIADDERNRNNRFEVAADLNRRISARAAPFWGCPPRRAGAWLHTTKPHGDVGHRLGEWRTVERALRATGRRPFSAWQLMGAGAVGSQSLVGIPVVEHLRARHAPRVEVWPFTTGLELPVLRPGIVVVAEVWPSLIDTRCGPDEIRDARQVAAVAGWIREVQNTDRLGGLFTARPGPGDGSAPIVTEEGWVVGVGATAESTHVGEPIRTVERRG